jgi:hypothetical protein
MGHYTITFPDEPRAGIDLPNRLLENGGWYELKVISGDVYITGNEPGLLYLAEVLTQAAKSDLPEQYHVHLPMDSILEGVDLNKVSDEIVVFGASETRL